MFAGMLVDGAPSTVDVGGVSVDINTSWRTGVRAMMAADDPELTAQEQAQAMLMLFYGRWESSIHGKRKIILPKIVTHAETALETALWFLNLGEPRKPQSMNGSSSQSHERTWDWEFDAWRVVADFQREYHIDLLACDDMHWWRFWSLFRGLSDSSRTMQAIGIRGMQIDAKMSAAEKKRIERMKLDVMLPARTREEAIRNTNMIWSLNV